MFSWLQNKFFNIAELEQCIFALTNEPNPQAKINKVGIHILVGILRVQSERVPISFFSDLHMKAKNEAMAGKNLRNIRYVDIAAPYISMTFFRALEFAHTPNAKKALLIILKFIEDNCSPSLIEELFTALGVKISSKQVEKKDIPPTPLEIVPIAPLNKSSADIQKENFQNKFDVAKVNIDNYKNQEEKTQQDKKSFQSSILENEQLTNKSKVVDVKKNININSDVFLNSHKKNNPQTSTTTSKRCHYCNKLVEIDIIDRETRCSCGSIIVNF